VNRIKISYEPAAAFEVIEIIRAEYLHDYQLHLWFHDGKEHDVDFEPFLRHARNPLFRKYLDLDEFKNFRLIFGNLDWNDYEMCFPVADLYDSKILTLSPAYELEQDFIVEA
jgi:hypothetical protein